MTGCFDFRLRASPSVDLDRITIDPNDVSRYFPMSFSKLFRSRSDGSVKTARSHSEGPSARARPRALQRSPSPIASAGVRRRRYVRVVRGDDAQDARHAAEENEHVIFRSRSFSAADRTRLKKSASADGGVAAVTFRGAQQLQRAASPYTSSGHTILKKYNHSLDGGTGVGDRAAVSDAGVTAASEVSPPNSKHTSFREEVEILEYETHGKALLVKCVTHTRKLNDEDDDDDEDSLNIDDSLDDDLESTDFCLTEIQDEATSASATTLATLALTPSPTSTNDRLSMDADAAAGSGAATLTDSTAAQGNRRYCVDSQPSSTAAEHSVTAFAAEKGLSLRTAPSSATPTTVVISDRPITPLEDYFQGSVESCLVADVHQLPTSESCQGNRLACSTTLISCDDNCSAIPSSSAVSSCPSISVSSCRPTQSSTCIEKSSTSPGQPSTVQLQAQAQQQKHLISTADAQALASSGTSSNVHRYPAEGNQKEVIDRQAIRSSSSTVRPPSQEKLL